MDLSDFKPPVRLSMTDEEIYQALGEAQATEDGLAKAMAIVEEQANLREHDKQSLQAWVLRMQQDPRPEAKIALENLEREKQGLDPLPLIAPAPEPVEAIAEPVVEVVEVIETFDEPQEVEISNEVEAFAEFEALLEEASGEATAAINVAEESPAAVVYESDLPVAVVESAPEEEALVTEESHAAQSKSSGWWASASFWTLISATAFPLAAAWLSAKLLNDFGTAVAGFALGLVINFGFIVSAHFTANRSSQDAVITRRASYGVFGAIAPGLAVLGAALLLVSAGSKYSVEQFSLVFALPFDVSAEVLPGVDVLMVIVAATIAAALLVAWLVKANIRYLNAVAAVMFVIAFVVAALATRQLISFGDVNWNVDPMQMLNITAITVIFSAFNYSNAPKVTRIAGSKATVARWSALGFAAIVLPLAVFAHFQLVYRQNLGEASLLSPIISVSMPTLASAVLWVLIFVVFVLITNWASASLREIKSFGLNKVSAWFVPLLIATTLAGLYFAELQFLNQVAIVIVAGVLSVAGVGVAESIIRRGEFHEASLLRSYGFYGSFNYLAVTGFVVSVALAFVPVTAVMVAGPFAFSLLWTFATAIPRIRTQQKEVAEVEMRKASLNSFSGFSE